MGVFDAITTRQVCLRHLQAEVLHGGPEPHLPGFTIKVAVVHPEALAGHLQVKPSRGHLTVVVAAHPMLFRERQAAGVKKFNRF